MRCSTRLAAPSRPLRPFSAFPFSFARFLLYVKRVLLRFRSVVDAAYDAIIAIDQQHCITLFNRAAEDLFGYPASEMLGQPITQLLPERYRANHSQYVDQFASSPVRSRQMDERNRGYGQHRDDTLLPVEIAISKLSVGCLIEFTAVIRDITDRVRLMDLLQKQAVTDELTRLPNRREFTATVETLLAAVGDHARHRFLKEDQRQLRTRYRQ